VRFIDENLPFYPLIYYNHLVLVPCVTSLQTIMSSNVVFLTFVENPSKFFLRFPEDEEAFRRVKWYERELRNFLSQRDVRRTFVPAEGSVSSENSEKT
jgi:hypothetical protein